MQIITTLSVGSFQGSYCLRDLHKNNRTNFFREKEISRPRNLGNLLLKTDVVCITLAIDDNICDVIDYCGLLLKILPNTCVKEVLLNDSLVIGKADKMEVYINELIDLLELSGLPVQRVSNFDVKYSNILDGVTVGKLIQVLDDVFEYRALAHKIFNKKGAFGVKNKALIKRKLRCN